MVKDDIQEVVKKAYGKIAQKESGCGCGTTCHTDAKAFAKSLGYSEDDLSDIPRESNLALSCGNPIMIADLKEGETVLDLGSGAGFDCFIAARKVGVSGKVIGVDMTPEMIIKAANNAKEQKHENVHFILGEIENLPLEDKSVDVVISNCVINLSSDKKRSLEEVFRVLKPGGRIAVSDIALLKELPDSIKKNHKAYTSCIAGAVLVNDYKQLLERAGFNDICIREKEVSICMEPDSQNPGSNPADGYDNSSLSSSTVSIYVTAGRKD